MDQDKSISEKLDDIAYQLSKKKEKKFKLPFKGRINRKRMKDGYVTIIKIEDNKNIDFTREPIVDGTIKMVDSFHAIDSDDVFFYKNKPIIFQPKKKVNPYNPLDGEHETYGQKYIMARMKSDSIITKKGMGMGMTIGGVILVGIIAYGIFFS